MSDVILWRHADAESGVPDLHRALTRKGEKQAKRVARWLHERLPANTIVFVSPARRAQQTASALAQLAPREFVTLDAIAPAAPLSAALGAVRATDRARTIVLVGHQPTLGELAAHLLGARLEDWPIRKGALLWLTEREHGDGTRAVLLAAMTPDLV
ncbi:MAG TPA: phosphohistidine phosphatase SixA [Burkholderiaceae bacterium]|nr:phosphohistidine phosphatase SixA [Burkholderiaceae bacterium]